MTEISSKTNANARQNIEKTFIWKWARFKSIILRSGHSSIVRYNLSRKVKCGVLIRILDSMCLSRPWHRRTFATKLTGADNEGLSAKLQIFLIEFAVIVKFEFLR